MNWEQHKKIPPNIVCALLGFVTSAVSSLQPHGLLCPWLLCPRLLCPWDSPGMNTGVGCHFLLQGTFPTQESNPGQVDSLLYEPQGRPVILERVACPFSSGTFRPRNQTGVSYIAGGFFTSWATQVCILLNFLTFTHWLAFLFLKMFCKFFSLLPCNPLQTLIFLLSR